MLYQVKQIALADLQVGEMAWAVGDLAPDKTLTAKYLHVDAPPPSLPALPYVPAH